MATKVYFWGGEHRDPSYTGGWVHVTWAAAVGSMADLRRLCGEYNVKPPRKPYQAKPGRDEWEAAMGHPGLLVFQNLEPTGDQSGAWQVLPTDL